MQFLRKVVGLMMITNEQLKSLIEGKIIGDKFPYNTKSEDEILVHMKRLYHRIYRIPNLVVEAEWNHFGSGYASFVEFFCYRKEDMMIEDDQYGNRVKEVDGILLDICRLAPVAIMGEDTRYKSYRIEPYGEREVGGGHGTLLSGPQCLFVSENPHPVAREIRIALEEFDYKLLEAEELNQPLPFKTKIPTLYREPKEYLVMDAIFYWED